MGEELRRVSEMQSVVLALIFSMFPMRSMYAALQPVPKITAILLRIQSEKGRYGMRAKANLDGLT